MAGNLARKYIEYCRRDTEITGIFVDRMLKKYKEIGCEPKTTIAATTLGYFEKQFYKKITHQFSEEQITFFHRGYYGGRTEIFHNRAIRGSIFYHDINSLYPWCMQQGQYPDLNQFYETKKPNYATHEGMADVEIQTTESLPIPYLPCKRDGKLIFPLGRWRGVYTFFELREAEKLGYRVLKTHRAVEFPTSHNPFKGFIDTIWAERLRAQKAGDELMSQVFKAFGNFAYGKYAQGNETTELIPIKQLKTIPDGTVILGDLALVHRKKKYPRYANCIWACYVTAYARHRLFYHGFSQVTGGGGKLLYCDTDSVLYRAPRPILEHSKNLGEFKLEGIYQEAYFKLPKLYYLIPVTRRSRQGILFQSTTGRKLPRATEWKSKGVPKSASKRFFTQRKARYKKPNKLRESLRRNLSPKNKNNLLIPNFWETREKEITGKYDKRLVLTTGETKPLIIKEGK